MTYYDNFEMSCGCRMWCKCDKAKWCERCQKTQVFSWSYPGWYCAGCGRSA